MRRKGLSTSQTAVTDRPAGESDQSCFEKVQVVVGAVLEDATVGVASCSFSPHVSVMQSTDAWQGHHLGVR